MSKDDLLNKIDWYWENHEATEEEDGRYWFPDDEDYNELHKVLMDELFEENHWNYETKEFLKEHGYRCWVGDGDSFGILVAVVTKDNKNFSVG